eukprot:scaffold10048_cov68-Phaeocystis_antarctica.AAC.4
MDLLKRGVQYGLADWVTTFIIAGLALCAEKGLAPFEHELGPQLADPRISYPHTPNAQSHCPKSLLIALAFILPLALIVSTQLLAPSTLDLNHALLGMISSLSYTLLLVALIKAAVGRLRPDFLARPQKCASPTARALSAPVVAPAPSTHRATLPPWRRLSERPHRSRFRVAQLRELLLGGEAAARTEAAPLRLAVEGDAGGGTVRAGTHDRPLAHRGLLAPLGGRGRGVLHRHRDGIHHVPAALPAHRGGRRASGGSAGGTVGAQEQVW